VVFDGYFTELRPNRRTSELTKIERDTLRYLAHGLRIRDVARLRAVSVNTVRKQVWTSRTKLGAKTTAHAVAIALRHGLIT
jgi:DNA-binding CsgD family transcriptional regulator